MRRATTTTNLSRHGSDPRHDDGSEVGGKGRTAKSRGQEKAKEEEEMSVSKAQEGGSGEK